MRLVIFMIFSFHFTFSAASPGTHIQREAATDGLCEGSLDLKAYIFMNKVCEECFNLYRDDEVYSACRSGCFGSSFFQGCMSNLMVDNHRKGKADAFLKSRFGDNGFGFDPISK